MRPFTSEGDLRVGNLQALTLEDFLGPESPYQFTAGTIDFAAKYKVDATRAPVKTGLHDMAITIRELAMDDRATGEEAITAASVATRGGAVDMLALQANLGQVVASGARIRLWMDASGKTNLQQWSRPPADTGAASWVTLIPKLEATGSALSFQERRIEPPPEIHVRGARVEMADYSTKAGTVSPLSVACSLGTSGWAEAKGTFTSGTGATDLKISMRDVDVRDLEGYITPFARIDLTRGTVGARGRFLWNSLGPRGPMLRFTGEVTSSRFASLDRRHRKELLSWDRLEVKDLEYDYAPSRVRIREIATVKPYIRFIIAPDMTTNIQGLQTPMDSLPVAFRPDPSAPRDTMPMEIGVVKVSDGSMYFADLSLTPNFGTGIVGMNGSIRELSSAQAAHAALDITGKADEFSPVTMTGTINPLNSRGLTDVGVKFENIELTTFTPYSGKFMGYRIDRGKLDLDLHYAIQDRQLEGENKILIRQLTLGEKVESKDATSLPVKFAIALLKDKNGDIDLDLPVSGSLDDPQFSVWKVVWKILGQLVVKAITSPFKLFGAIFGGDDTEVAPAIAFPYGSAELDT
ncbi:MAG TPA: DUF748 domain-containing protein, partial [Candidatus Eisenbacteria bacterium]|nr:DUF748 domain-containing protein [Candidatus Eisenbacteria bacterium]